MRAMQWLGIVVAVFIVAGCGKKAATTVQTVSITLKGHVTITGVSDATGQVVTLAGPSSGATATAADGSYQFAGLAAGSYAITATVPSTRETMLVASVTLSGKDESAGPTLTFTPVGRVEGVATKGAATGNAGILVWVDGTGFSSFTDDAGHYLIEGVPAGSWTVRAAADGYAVGHAAVPALSWKQKVSAPALELEPLPGSVPSNHIRGRVTLIGSPSAERVVVTVEGTEFGAVTDAMGEFDIGGVATGVYSLTFDKGEFHERVPSVLSMPGVDGFIVDGALHPITAVNVPRATRRVTDEDLSIVVKSNDRSMIAAFAASSGRPAPLHVVKSTGEAVIAGTQSSGYTSIFTADNSRLLFLDAVAGGRGVLRSMALATGVATDIGNEVADYTFQLSPNGSKVAFLSDYSPSTGLGKLQIAPVAGGSAVTLSTEAFVSKPRFSPDGTRVIYLAPSSQSSGAVSLFVRDVAATSPAIMLADNVERYGELPPFSPDGSLVPVVGTDRSLQLYPLTGAAPIEIDNYVTSYSIRFVGDRLLYVRDNNDGYHRVYSLWSVGTDGSDWKRIGEEVLQGQYQLAPDEQHVLFVAAPDNVPHGPLTSARLDGSDSVTLADDVPSTSYWFSPDSQQAIYFVGNQGGVGALELQDIGGSTPVRLSDESVEWVQYSHDSKLALFFTDYDSTLSKGTLTQVTLSSGTTRTIASDVAGWRANASEDFSRVLFLRDLDPQNGTGRLFTLPLSGTGAETELLGSVSTLEWGTGKDFFATSNGRLPPFRFQNGVYTSIVP